MFQPLFERLFAKNGCEPARADAFEELYLRLVRANQTLNLTAITDAETVIVRHFADCVKTAALFKPNASVLDVGCGGGFPTLPLAIVRPDLKITALDATAKKLAFVQQTAEALGLSNVQTCCGRAETLAHGELRETFDAVTSRAVARLAILSELCMGFVRVGGVFVAMKGAAAGAELYEATPAIRTLGGELLRRDAFTLSDGSARENLVFSKQAPTPDVYPRTAAKLRRGAIDA